MADPQDLGPDDMECAVVDAQGALALAARLYGLSGGTARPMDGYDDKNFWLQNHKVDGNPFLSEVAEDGYTLKVTNSLDSRNQDFVQEQTCLLAHLADRGIDCPRPVRNKAGKTYSIETFRENGPGHAVRLLQFVPGEILGKVPWQPDFASQAGREIAKLHNLMDELDLPAVKTRTTEWSLWEAPRVLKYAHYVTDTPRRALVEEVLVAFQRDTEAQTEYLRGDTGLIHGDYNQHNIVVRAVGEAVGEGSHSGPYAVAGVLDVGDCHSAPRTFEVALTGAYMAMTSGGRVQAIADVLGGYTGERPLSSTAVDLLRVCICARLCQSLVMGLRAHALNPKNTYVLDSQKYGWLVLQDLWTAPNGQFEQEWKKAIKEAQVA